MLDVHRRPTVPELEACTLDEALPTTRRSYDVESLLVERIGSLDAVPHLAIAPKDVYALRLDHAAGFVLAQVDGATSVETLLDVSCVIPRVDVLRILGDLDARGVVAFS